MFQQNYIDGGKAYWDEEGKITQPKNLMSWKVGILIVLDIMLIQKNTLSAGKGNIFPVNLIKVALVDKLSFYE